LYHFSANLTFQQETTNGDSTKNGHTTRRPIFSTNALGGNRRTAADRIALLAELTGELLDNPDRVAEDIGVAGEEAVRTATRLGQLLRSGLSNGVGDTVTSSSLPGTSTLPAIPAFHGHRPSPKPSVAHQPHIIPPLPPIADTSLSELPFKHQGMLRSHEATSVNGSYERLEFLGDAYLEIIASRLIYSRFPHLGAGRMSQVREMLIKNETLAEYAVQYGFDKQAKIPRSHQESGKLWIKTMGDIFEAYVAAVILANTKDGFPIAENWLTDLWTPKLLEQNIAPKSCADAKPELARRIMGKNIKVSYLDEGGPEMSNDGKRYFHIGVYLTGWGWSNQLLGSGRGLNKVEAGTNAAMAALANTPLIDEIAAVKQAYDARVKEQRARESKIEPNSTIK